MKSHVASSRLSKCSTDEKRGRGLIKGKIMFTFLPSTNRSLNTVTNVILSMLISLHIVPFELCTNKLYRKLCRIQGNIIRQARGDGSMWNL
jgi:hypothetical protein